MFSHPLIIAHRGASGEAPENTLAAIERALSLDVDFIEFDVRITADGVPIAIHDENVSRTTNTLNTLPIEKMSLAEIRSHDVGEWFGPQFKGQKIPTLDEILKLDRGRCGLMIEIKKGLHPAKETGSIIYKTLVANNIQKENQVLVGSFDTEILSTMVDLGCPLDLIGIAEDHSTIQEMAKLPLKKMAICQSLLQETLIQQLSGNGVETWTFTVDEPHEAHQLHRLGVKGIITNHPQKHKIFFKTKIK